MKNFLLEGELYMYVIKREIEVRYKLSLSCNIYQVQPSNISFHNLLLHIFITFYYCVSPPLALLPY